MTAILTRDHRVPILQPLHRHGETGFKGADVSEELVEFGCKVANLRGLFKGGDKALYLRRLDGAASDQTDLRRVRIFTDGLR
jgi:hypothetical protein